MLKINKVETLNNENCFVCNKYMGPYRNPIFEKTEFSQKAVYLFIGKNYLLKNLLNQNFFWHAIQKKI